MQGKLKNINCGRWIMKKGEYLTETINDGEGKTDALKMYSIGCYRKPC